MPTNFQRCFYHINVESGKSVKIDFQVFSMPSSSSCYYGYVIIYEDRVGYDPNLKATFCGNGSKTFQSDSNRVIVEFQSRSYRRKRFYATYSTINKGIQFLAALSIKAMQWFQAALLIYFPILLPFTSCIYFLFSMKQNS